jgi:hypothetical protein
MVIIGNVYNALMHKIECGQSYYKDLLERILNKFTLYFPSFIQISMDFRSWNQFLEY